MFETSSVYSRSESFGGFVRDRGIRGDFLGSLVEPLVLYFRHGFVPSQVGCQMACTFCATGTMGLKGDLTAGEILEQVLHASRVAPIRNVVFMGERLQRGMSVC